MLKRAMTLQPLPHSMLLQSPQTRHLSADDRCGHLDPRKEYRKKQGVALATALNGKLDSLVKSDFGNEYSMDTNFGNEYSMDLNFGNFSTNYYVYMGGLPSWYSTKLSSLALPSVVFEPRFRGSIRNLLYADDATGRPKIQELMAYKVRVQSQETIFA